MKFYSYSDIDGRLSEMIKQMNSDNFSPDIILGLSRGGLPMGVILSHNLDVEFLPLIWSSRDFPNQKSSLDTIMPYIENKNNILIVDDIADSGESLIGVSNCLKNLGKNIRYGCLFKRYSCEFDLDFCGELIAGDEWLVFPWETKIIE